MTDLLVLTAQLVDHPSETFAEGPFVNWLEQELNLCSHLKVERIGDNLVARTDLGLDQRLILAGHTDTVPANGNSTAQIRGDRLDGLGSADMKAGLAVFLELARTVAAPTVDLTYVFYAREEVARHDSGLLELRKLRPDLLAGDAAILGEPTDATIEAGCQGAIRVEVTMRGERAHTARPWMGRNAIHRLAPALTALENYEARQPTIDGCTYREAVQAVSVEGGAAGNVVPDEAKFKIHHRFAPDRSAVDAEAFINELLEDCLAESDSVEVIDSAAACPPSLNHPLLQKLLVDNSLEVRAKLGWTDVAQFAELGIPATNFGPGDPTVAHTAGEFVERKSIEQVYAALHRLVSTG